MSLNSNLYKKFFLSMLLSIRGDSKVAGTFMQVITIVIFSAGIVGREHGLGYAI